MKRFILFLIIIISILYMTKIIECRNDEPYQRTAEEEKYQKLYDDFYLKGIGYKIWLGIENAEYRCSLEENRSGVNYWPASGLRGLYCMVKSYISISTIQRISGKKIFIKGPHDKNGVDLYNYNSFAHYNPEFIKWAAENLIPADNDIMFREFSQKIYDKYFKSLCRTYFTTYLVLAKKNELKENELKKYMQIMKEGRHFNYYQYTNFLERYNSIKNAKYIFGPNLTTPSVGFWLRRSLDGTEKDFNLLLKKVLEIYDNTFLIDIIPITETIIQ
ncbi:MAG: hypothetical protein ACMUJM_26100 [bacterium]